MQFDRINPLTGKTASSAKAMQPADIGQIAERAQAGFEQWSVQGPNARRAFLSKAAAALEARADSFVEAMMNEIGSTRGWAMFNLGLAAGMIREAAALTTQIGGEVIPSDKPGTLAMALREPVGVVLGIAPWNAPIILGVRSIAMPLACGNAVILKASETCPRTHELIVEAFQEAGFPEGTVNAVTHSAADAPEVVAALIDAPEVRRINFTGSTKVGRLIAKRAAEHLKPVLLELGGKSPMVILDDADLDEAVKAAAFGAFMNQGQICMTTERIIVVDAIADEFVARFRDKASGLAVGDPREEKTQLGAVGGIDTAKTIRELVQDALENGAEQLVGSEIADNVLVPAHVIDRVTPEMKLFRDESFGPVVAITRARDEEHAVSLANDTEYGLSSAIFSADVQGALELSQQLETGISHINGPTIHDEPQMPFGGVKASGYGRFGGKAAIEEFTELRWVTIQSGRGVYPI